MPVPGCVLGFDVGARRTGVAIGNTLSGAARDLSVIDADSEAGWRALERLVNDWQPERFVVGEPLTLDGGDQPATRRARRFAQQLRERFRLPVELVDERRTSIEAADRFAARRREGVARRRDAERLDALAAQLILERWLGEHARREALAARGAGSDSTD